MTTNSKIFIDTSGQSDLFAYHAAQARSKNQSLLKQPLVLNVDLTRQLQQTLP